MRRGGSFKEVQILAEEIVKYLGLLTERAWENRPHDTWVNILRRRYCRQASEVFAEWEMYEELERLVEMEKKVAGKLEKGWWEWVKN